MGYEEVADHPGFQSPFMACDNSTVVSADTHGDAGSIVVRAGIYEDGGSSTAVGCSLPLGQQQAGMMLVGHVTVTDTHSATGSFVTLV